MLRYFSFLKKNIEDKELLYVMKKNDLMSTEDHFIFSVEDTKPNKIFNNIFNIHWSRIHFDAPSYNISETSGILELTVKRIGNKHLDFTALCKVENTVPHQKVNDSLVAVVDEVHFKENDVIKYCIFRVIDNSVFEQLKHFKVTLKSAVPLLGSPSIALVSISDEEDEPIISFKENMFKINETGDYYHFPVIRQGDLFKELSVLCITSDVTAQGSNGSSLQSRSDYRSREPSHKSFITFPSGVSEVMCSVKIIDDNLFEEQEEFLLVLSDPHPVGKIQNFSKAHVIIQGPNDASYVYIQQKNQDMFIGDKNSSVVIIRQGLDISHTCTVWCGSSLFSSVTKKDEINTYYEINFTPFENSTVCFIRTDLTKQKVTESTGALNIFLDSPKGCLLGEPNKITVPLKERVIYPVIEFKDIHIAVLENAGTVLLPVLRTGNTSSSATLLCFTQEGTAHAKEDFEERYKTKMSRIHFSPGQKEIFCPLNIYDDDIFEGNELFQVHLLPLEEEIGRVILGSKKSVTVEILDSDDVTTIEIEKSHYLVNQESSPNSSTSAILSVVRHGDVSLQSKIRISTIDGSALSGLDYYAKSKLLKFQQGEKKKAFEIEILYNQRRNWALSFTVLLGPDEVVNAEIGNRSKATVTIPRVYSTESLILPTVPIVVSLTHYSDVKKGMIHDAISGYPLICVTPCDVNHPDYAITSALCRDSGINSSSMSYSWEIAMPLSSDENMSSFVKITDSTLFTSVHERVLDSIYFRPHEIVRCVAQPQDSKGHLGIPLRSKSIRISSDSGFCLMLNKLQYSTSSITPFIATLNYINSTDAYHPNKLHIHVEIPHEDGLLPLISTYPLRNIDFLLMQNIYRQQHVCSNILETSDKSFMRNLQPQMKDIISAFPFHAEQSTKGMQLIYQHLDIKKCKWSFDAWYTMSDLVELCGGTVVSDFKAKETDRTYVSVLLPFYVTYVYSTAPTGWTSAEHRTEIEFSFFYNAFLGKAGSHTDDSFNALLSIIRIGTDSTGHLFFEFKTVANFYGCFVMDHHTLPGVKSHLTAPFNFDIKFDLQLLWSEQSFDGPTQYWKAKSNYNLKDYSGLYAVHLIPCKVLHTEQFSLQNGLHFLPCIAYAPKKFDLPITFQQTPRPQPVVYALETFFQLFNDQNLFMLNPFENHPNFQYIEYNGAFSKGEHVYGRVFWSPKQELESAYQLKIIEVLLCSAKNGYVPHDDPIGKIYEKGPQYGCLIPNKNLKYKFTLLNRNNPYAIDTEFQGSSFQAKFIENIPLYSKLSEVAGVDGFMFKTDPLYQMSSNQWFLQVIYSIKPSNLHRARRSSDRLEFYPADENQTKVKMIILNTDGRKPPGLLKSDNDTNQLSTFGAHHVMYILSVILIVVGIIIIRHKNPKLAHQTSKNELCKYTWATFNTKASFKKSYQVVECKQKIKQREKCKITVYTPKHVPVIDSSSGTEV